MDCKSSADANADPDLMNKGEEEAGKGNEVSLTDDGEVRDGGQGSRPLEVNATDVRPGVCFSNRINHEEGFRLLIRS